MTVAKERPGRRRYPLPSKQLFMASMGRGVVVTCHPERIAWLRTTLAGRERDEIFGAPTIAELSRYVARDGQTLGGRPLLLPAPGKPSARLPTRTVSL